MRKYFTLVDQTEEMINQGMEMVKLLGSRASETTRMTETVGERGAGAPENLLAKVEDLNRTAGTLGENMQELKTEISVFRV